MQLARRDFAPATLAQLDLATRCAPGSACLRPYACDACGLLAAAGSSQAAGGVGAQIIAQRCHQPPLLAAKSGLVAEAEAPVYSPQQRLASLVRTLCAVGVLSPLASLEESWQRCYRSAPIASAASLPLGEYFGSSGSSGRAAGSPAVSSPATGQASALDWLPFPLSERLPSAALGPEAGVATTTRDHPRHIPGEGESSDGPSPSAAAAGTDGSGTGSGFQRSQASLSCNGQVCNNVEAADPLSALLASPFLSVRQRCEGRCSRVFLMSGHACSIARPLSGAASQPSRSTRTLSALPISMLALRK